MARARRGRGSVIRAFHGTPHDFGAFDPARAADGHAQEGAVFYFTTSAPDAAGYAGEGGRVLVVELDVGREPPARGPVTAAHRRDAEALVRRAPDLANTLTNWDENPARAMAAATRAALSAETPKGVFESVCYEFFRGNPAAFSMGMSDLGYGGTVLERAPDADGAPVRRVLMYDPAKIRVVDVLPKAVAAAARKAPRQEGASAPGFR